MQVGGTSSVSEILDASIGVISAIVGVGLFGFGEKQIQALWDGVELCKKLEGLSSHDLYSMEVQRALGCPRRLNTQADANWWQSLTARATEARANLEEMLDRREDIPADVVIAVRDYFLGLSQFFLNC